MASLNTVHMYSKKLSGLTSALVSHAKQYLARYPQLAEERKLFLNDFNKTICSNNSGMFPVGSMVTKLSYNERSDVDLCFMVKDDFFWAQFHANPDYRRFFMNMMGDMIVNNCKSIRLKGPPIKLYFTKVPLLVFEMENGFNMDIQFPTVNYQSLRNSHLVRHYVLADERLSQLFLYVRTLFKTLGLHNSRDRLFSSFHIVCLVIHFLQRTDGPQPSVLPILFETHSARFNCNIPIKKIIQENDMADHELEPLNWKSENTQTVGELVVDFFDYYANKFNPEVEFIRLNCGTTFPKRISHDPRGGRLVIFDPYGYGTVCRSDTIIEVFTPTFQYIFKGLTERGEFMDSFPHFTDENAAYRKHFESEWWGVLLNSDIASDTSDIKAESNENAANIAPAL